MLKYMIIKYSALLQHIGSVQLYALSSANSRVSGKFWTMSSMWLRVINIYNKVKALILLSQRLNRHRLSL